MTQGSGSSSAAPPAAHSDSGSRMKRISDAVMDVLHIHTHVDAHPPCELAAAVLAKVKEEMGGAFGAAEAAFCDPACLQRYLRARSMDVGKAAAMLKHTLEWRREFGVDALKVSDYRDFVDEGWIYQLGNDEAGHTTMMLRKRTSRLEEHRIDNFVGFLVMTLETAVRSCKNGTEKLTWIFDMKGYDSRNSPRVDHTLRVLSLVANHYPERLNKVFIVEAPTIFWVLFKAVSPFLDAVTRSKVEFVYNKDVAAAAAASAPASAGTAPADDSAADLAAAAQAGGAAAAAAAADTSAARFLPYAKWYAAPFDPKLQAERFAAAGFAA